MRNPNTGHLSETPTKENKNNHRFCIGAYAEPTGKCLLLDKLQTRRKKMSPDSQSFMITTVCKEIILRLIKS